MTPPSEVVSTVVAVRRRPADEFAASLCRRFLDPSQWSRILLLTDLIVLYLASSVALVADRSVRDVLSNQLIALFFPIVVVAMLRARRDPEDRLNVSLLDILFYVLGVVSLAAMLTISVEAIIGASDPLALAPRLWVFAVVYLGLVRGMFAAIRSQAVRAAAMATPTVIVGAGMIGAQLVKRLVEDPSYGLRPVAFVDSNPLPTPIASAHHLVPVLGGLNDLQQVVERTGAQHVILAFSAEPDHVLVAKVRECETLGIKVSMVPRLYETINERTTLDHVGGLPLLTFHTIDPRGWQFAIKHVVDRTVAVLALLVASPLMLAAAISVRLSSPGPILFRQRRVGRDGREFDVLKFRTMRVVSGAAGETFTLPQGVAPGGVEGSDRRTRIGCILRDSSIDELPQLFNVLRGDMSLVGPRPERREYVSRFARDVARYEDRHRVKSGITGWAQVHGLRGQTSIVDRVEWDNYYIQNWSLRLDLRIVALTVTEVFRHRDMVTEQVDADADVEPACASVSAFDR